MANGWHGLMGILETVRSEAADDRAAPPVACPNDGEPLEDVNGVLHCRYDGWTYRSNGVTGASSDAE